jgi:hypothetical protein
MAMTEARVHEIVRQELANDVWVKRLSKVTEEIREATLQLERIADSHVAERTARPVLTLAKDDDDA